MTPMLGGRGEVAELDVRRPSSPNLRVVNSGAFFYFLLHNHIINIKSNFLFPVK
jgi:hypothetical protein